jgi:hypothetical protein
MVLPLSKGKLEGVTVLPLGKGELEGVGRMGFAAPETLPLGQPWAAISHFLASCALRLAPQDTGTSLPCSSWDRTQSRMRPPH